MAERATRAEPNGVTVTVGGEVVVRGDGVRPGAGGVCRPSSTGCSASTTI
jgi:hypothetical protein